MDKYSLFLIRLNKLKKILHYPRLVKTLLVHRVLAGIEHHQALSGDFKTVIDVGANRGQFALAARQFCPHSRVISFEPLSEPSDKFKELFKGDPFVTFYQAAIGMETGEETINVSGHDDSSSLLPIGPKQTALFPGTGAVRTEKIKAGRLVHYISAEEIVRPAMLKLDVQGFELYSLRGCEELLDRFSSIYVECSFEELYIGQALAHDVIAWLHERSFILKGVYNMAFDRDGRCIQGDFLFSKIQVKGK